MKLKIAYFGTPSFAADLLKKILTDPQLPVEVKLVATQEDKKVGRKQILTPTPVKLLGQQYKIEVFDKDLKDLSLKEKLKDIDICIVYAYGKMIPNDILKLPRLGFWNIHPSLLPKYRGPSPITYPLLLNDKETGVSLMLMDTEMDHGPILAQKKYELDQGMSRNILEKTLTDIGYDLLKVNILTVVTNKITNQSLLQCSQQNHSKATYTRKLTKDDGFIPLDILKLTLEGKNTDWKPQIIHTYFERNSSVIEINKDIVQNSSLIIFNLFQSFHPWPGIWTKVIINDREMRLKITDVKIFNNTLTLKNVQLEGKNEVEFKVFNTAYKIF